MKASFRVGSRFRLSSDALENYGQQYRDQVFVVNEVYRSRAEHPGFDESAGSPLYEADGFPGALYEWEMERA